MNGSGALAPDRLDRVRQPEIQEPVRGVEDVRAPVAERAGAVLEPAAPVPRMQLRAVGVRGPRGQPLVPVQPGRQGLAGRVAVDRPAVPPSLRVHERVDARHVPDDAGLGPRLELEVVVARVALVAHLRDHAGLRGHGHQQVDLAERVGERLLDVDVLAARHRVHRRREVAVIRRADETASIAGAGLLEHRAEVAESRDVRVEAPDLGRVRALEVHVAEGHEGDQSRRARTS